MPLRDLDIPPPVRMPQFVERQTFRRRRMVDAACALPFLGLLLWLLPLLWRAPDMEVAASRALIYLFSIWLILPILTGLLIRAIRRNTSPDRPGRTDKEVTLSPEAAP